MASGDAGSGVWGWRGGCLPARTYLSAQPRTWAGWRLVPQSPWWGARERVLQLRAWRRESAPGAASLGLAVSPLRSRAGSGQSWLSVHLWAVRFQAPPGVPLGPCSLVPPALAGPNGPEGCRRRGCRQPRTRHWRVPGAARRGRGLVGFGRRRATGSRPGVAIGPPQGTPCPVPCARCRATPRRPSRSRGGGRAGLGRRGEGSRALALAACVAVPALTVRCGPTGQEGGGRERPGAQRR